MQQRPEIQRIQSLLIIRHLLHAKLMPQVEPKRAGQVGSKGRHRQLALRDPLRNGLIRNDRLQPERHTPGTVRTRVGHRSEKATRTRSQLIIRTPKKEPRRFKRIPVYRRLPCNKTCSATHGARFD